MKITLYSIDAVIMIQSLAGQDLLDKLHQLYRVDRLTQ